MKSPCDAGVVLAGRAVVPCRKGAERWVLAATILGSSMAFIDGTAVNVALSALQADLRATVAEARRAVDGQREKLAALEIPAGLSEPVRARAKAAVDEAFLDGYRGVMLTAAWLALLASLSAAWLIQSRGPASVRN